MEQYLYYGSLGPHERQYAVPNFLGLARHPAHDREMAHDAVAALPFADGTIAKVQAQDVFEHLPFEKLRRACPCAGCGGEPDVMGYVVRPQVTYTPKSFEIKSYQIIGGYALQPIWQDGHSSGLYTFDFLRRLATGEPHA